MHMDSRLDGPQDSGTRLAAPLLIEKDQENADLRRLRTLRGSNTRVRCVLLALSALICLATSSAAQTILNVDTAVDDLTLSACSDAVPNDCSLRGAIDTANSIAPDTEVTIDLPSGTYELTIPGLGDDLNFVGDLDILRSMTLRRAYGVVYIHGGGEGGLNDHLLDIHGSGTVVDLEDINVVFGKPSAGLHAVNVRDDTQLRAIGVRFENNGTLANGGGAIAVAAGGSASISGALLRWNYGAQGAAVRVSGTLLATDSVFTGNYTNEGGAAVALVQSFGIPTATFEDCTFYANTSTQDGGALWASDATEMTLRRSHLYDNESWLALDGRGGAIYSRAVVNLEHSTLSGNQADRGGAIFINAVPAIQGQLDMMNTTFSANTNVVAGAAAIELVNTEAEHLFVTHTGQALDVHLDGQSMQYLTATLFDGGCDLDPGASVATSGGNVVPDGHCLAFSPAASDLFAGDLQLLPLGEYDGPTPTHLPSPASPAVLAYTGACPATDQRGLPRPAGPCGSGAVERQAAESFLFSDGFESGDTATWSAVSP